VQLQYQPNGGGRFEEGSNPRRTPSCTRHIESGLRGLRSTFVSLLAPAIKARPWLTERTSVALRFEEETVSQAFLKLLDLAKARRLEPRQDLTNPRSRGSHGRAPDTRNPYVTAANKAAIPASKALPSNGAEGQSDFKLSRRRVGHFATRRTCSERVTVAFAPSAMLHGRGSSNGCTGRGSIL
jgi:hypothetical protein